MFKAKAIGLQDAKSLALRQGEKTLRDVAAQQLAGRLRIRREQIRQIRRHLHQLVLRSPMLKTKEQARHGIKRARKDRHLPLMQLPDSVGPIGKPAHGHRLARPGKAARGAATSMMASATLSASTKGLAAWTATTRQSRRRPEEP